MPPCIIDTGHVSVEVGLADWTRERDASSRTDTVTSPGLLVRYGIDSRDEVQLGWDGIGHIRSRDFATGEVDKVSRAGDLTLRLRHNFVNPDGSGTSIAIAPYVTLPTGRAPVGAGDWGAGLDVPISIALNKTFSITSLPEIAAAVDQDGHGRHFEYGSTLGLALNLSEAFNGTIEFAAYHDLDPSGHSTQAMLGAAAGFKVSDNLQFDAGSVFGLNHATADVELYAGVSRRF
jgi:hypothetical protein